MEFSFRPLTQADANAVDSWRYEPPFDFYNLDADPADREEFLEASNWPGSYFAVEDADGTFVGFFSFSETDGVVTIGLGMAPDLTGGGLGEKFLRTGLAFARERFDPTAFELAVAAFNERAIRVYERVGFEETGRYEQETNGGEYEFVTMRMDLR
ncbi:GNAT family N-acetyltransferase [Haladaptatus sp. GCM10025707]|uniref:GNAT family N-acetyltransferase n=1 Tax=unclassified Haladaptatus TaxID=2622732 RepID=UPI0023E867B9|nr:MULTISPECIES: GNAT family protein [unclassified Haladaptatus]